MREEKIFQDKQLRKFGRPPGWIKKQNIAKKKKYSLEKLTDKVLKANVLHDGY